MKKLLLSTAVATLLSSSLFAGVNSQTGCGLGSQIISDDSSALMLALQATTNGTSGNQTFGISSGTLGCEKTKFVMNERAEKFVASNMDQLSKEVAMGQGETLDTLAELLEVENKIEFSTSLQKNYTNIYKSSNSQMSEVLDNIASI